LRYERRVDAALTPVTLELEFPEAPRWFAGQLWCSDMIGRRICAVGPNGSLATTVRFDEMPGGIGFLPDGTPLVVGMSSGRVYVIVDQRPQSYADLRTVAGVHLDDMVVLSDGTAYIGASGDRTANKVGAPPAGGIVRVSPHGTVIMEAEGLAFPNGMAISADGRRLLVNETFAERITAFDIEDSGALSNRRLWAALPGLHPDGLTVDDAGAAWVGCYLEEKFVRVCEGGDVTDVIPSSKGWATGVALGGPDGHTLFMCSADTDVRRFFRGESHGRIDAARVDVPAAGVVA
jgi:sugar lactone lactonase YvrE